MQQVKMTQLVQLIKQCYRVRRPIMAWGSPGIGKSAALKQAAAELDIDFRDVRLSLLDPVDLRGMPVADNGRMHFLPPSFLPLAGTDADERGGILGLDEINAASRMIQAASYQILYDHCIGETPLSSKWSVVAAGNLSTDRAVTERMGTAQASRMVHVELVVDRDDWCDWAISNGKDTRLVAFIRFRPELLHKFDPKQVDPSFPCPRTWEFADDFLQLGLPAHDVRALVAGTVGEGAAGELLKFLQVCEELPDMDALIADPDKATVPEEPNVLYAICSALVDYASVDNIKNIVRYALRLPDDFSVCVMTDLVKRADEDVRGALFESKEFVDWANKHHDVMFDVDSDD